MNPILADSIDFGFVFMYGLVVLVPLLSFEVGIEALILRSIWRAPFGQMARFTLIANGWSLLAGIPTKFLNAGLYQQLLPDDIPVFFARYPFAVGVGTLIYFIVTVFVEAAYAFRWQRRQETTITRNQLWIGILLANTATYSVLAPVHYYATRPMNEIREFTRDVRWSSHSATRVVYIDAVDGHLKVTRLDGSTPETIVPLAVKDYLLSADLGLCLFRSADQSLELYRRTPVETNRILLKAERLNMNQVAFSPSGRRVALVNGENNYLGVVDVSSARRLRQPVSATNHDYTVAWSPEESKF